MSILSGVARVAPRGLPSAVQRLIDEALVLASALLQPGRVIGEVEQMRALQLQADAIEAVDPSRAKQLRARASRIGLR